ncbi:glutamyl-tRNA synthetase [Babesia caballi]|uniref:Glutamyl-tRNA synthetase n=1 Tax=Babesia caballi TaxID=5871 RepID=A0AAV4LLY4_BABCB|nr:glutamyl-tRNA synthetase [Babesia caballi]
MQVRRVRARHFRLTDAVPLRVDHVPVVLSAGPLHRCHCGAQRLGELRDLQGDRHSVGAAVARDSGLLLHHGNLHRHDPVGAHGKQHRRRADVRPPQQPVAAPAPRDNCGRGHLPAPHIMQGALHDRRHVRGALWTANVLQPPAHGQQGRPVLVQGSGARNVLVFETQQAGGKGGAGGGARPPIDRTDAHQTGDGGS